MFGDPIVIVLWALAPAAIVFGLSFLPARFPLNIGPSNDQPWGCRAVSLVLLFALGAPFVVWFPSSIRILAHFFERRPWLFQGLLFILQGIPVIPVTMLFRRYNGLFLRTVGLTRDRAIYLGAVAAATYFMLVFLRSALRHFSGEGWTGLYTNTLYGPDFYRWPLSHALVLVAFSLVAGGVEELVFRGVALIPIARVLGPTGGIVVTALLWSMSHFDFARTLATFPLGLFLGWLFYRTGSLVPSITFHVLANLGAGSDLVFGRLRAAGVHWTSAQHFHYVGLGSLGVALCCATMALLARQNTRPEHRT